MAKSNKHVYRLYSSITIGSIRVVVMILLAAFLVTVCELSIPWLLEKVIDEATSEVVNTDNLNEYGLLIVLLIFAIYIIHHIYVRLEVKFVCDMSFQIYQRLYKHIIYQPISYFKRKKSGEILHRVSNDTSAFESSTRHLVSELPYEVMISIGVLIMMVTLDAVLALIVTSFLVITSIISAKIGRPLPTLERRVQFLGARFVNRIQEVIQGIKTVKNYGREDYELSRLDQANRNRVEVIRSSGHIESYLLPIFDLMEVLGVGVVVWYGAHLIVEGSLTAGGLVAFIAYMELLAGPVSKAGKHYRRWQESFSMARRITEFLQDTDDSSQYQKKQNLHTDHVIDTLAIRDLGFSYPNSTNKVLSNITIAACKNEIVALVGRNGAGKSTLVDIFEGIYAPSSGSITVGGVDLREWSQQEWRTRLGKMSQDVFLFNTSIRENIVYGKPDATFQEIEKACNISGVDNVLKKHDKGLAFVVGEKGGRLSGGERQRIALARLFLMNPDVIIYDEPTAAMDGEAVKDVSQAIQGLAKGRISFIISHDADIVAIADKVILLDEGRVIATGTHRQLMEQQALYRSLFETRTNELSGYKTA